MPAAVVSLHPVVETYLQGRDIRMALGELKDSGDPLLAAMSGMRQARDAKAIEAAIQKARRVSVRKADPNLFILFLKHWAQACLNLQRYDEAGALLDRARSLFGAQTPPELQAGILCIEGVLEGFGRGNIAGYEERNRAALAVLPETSGRRKNVVWERVRFLCQIGRLSEAEADLRFLLSLGAAFRSRVCLARFIQAIETGALDEAGGFLPEIERDKNLMAYEADVLRRYYRPIYEILQGSFEEAAPPFPASVDEFPSPDPRHAAQVLVELQGRRPAEALSWARLDVPGRRNSITGIGFYAYNLLRAELAARNGEAGRRILELRRGRGNLHYLDDFFLARVELLAGNREGAARHFAALLSALERWRAQGRLDIELRLAPEIAPGEIVRLVRAAAAPIAPPEPLPPPPRSPRGVTALVGPSAATEAVREAIRKFAHLEIPVLITGETGTGKELVARALHEERLQSPGFRAQGPRFEGPGAENRGPKAESRPGEGRPDSRPRAGPRSENAAPFIPVNCGALAETLLETELFGHERGAFTGADQARRGVFEEAGEGTIFLDEIGEISPRLQVMLLRVLETNEIRPVGSARSRWIACRIVVATNAPVDRLVEEARFRRDLLFRLQRLEIRLLPLRERPQDILPLAAHFLDLGRRAGQRAVLAADLKEALLAYPWPGNVRELRNEIERMRLMNSDRISYGLGDLHPRIQDAARRAGAFRRREGGPLPGSAGAAGLNAAAGRAAPDPAAILEQSVSPLRRKRRLQALFREHGELTRAEVASILRISLNTATRYLKNLTAEGTVRRVEPSRAPRTHYFVWNNREMTPTP